MKIRSQTERRFLCIVFLICFGILLLMSGLHVGLVVGMNELGWSKLLQTILVILYWAAVAAGLAFFVLMRIRKMYEEPLQRLAEATKQVAEGDFSVYVPTIHTMDQYDYLDRMILDFNKMVEELGSIETLKTDFFADVSHEMKAPVAAISSSAQLLIRPGISEERRADCARNILDASRRMNSLITNMLKLSKLERQTIQPVPERFDVCEQLAESVFPFEDALEKKHLDLETDMDDRAYILADPELLALVWTNLLSNAIKFTADGGMIALRQRITDGFVEIAVADTGCGMDKETQHHIFEKFYQGDASHATAGNGLGLALVKRILELSGGTINVKSRQGEGSVFTVRLPLAKEETVS